MNKKIILCGDACTGKTFTAFIMQHTYNNVVLIQALIFAEKLIVERQCKAPFKIKIPDVIITFDGNHYFFKDFGISFFMRCKIIECSKDGHLFLHKEVKFHNTVNQLIN